ncbi:hypothetical protein [Mitsuaria sp. 7]|uniref:hypothetical protein n=1 Tax=Mitsuaria sp. 7 TaxID=1658665 RepID=UPI0012FBEEC3|nr:hypothetical protein [Mitsuaria sp. 7]
MSRKAIGRVLGIIFFTAVVAGCDDILWLHENHVKVSTKNYPQCARIALAGEPVEGVSDFLGDPQIIDFSIPVRGGHRPVAGRIQRDGELGLKVLAFSKGLSEPEEVKSQLDPILKLIASGLQEKCGAP